MTLVQLTERSLAGKISCDENCPIILEIDAIFSM
jgi:hypothetical protein